jgi:putative flippase GtrA
MDLTIARVPENDGASSSHLLFREGWKYLLASAIALVIDYGVLIALTKFFGIYYLVSAAIGFCIGCAASYVLSVRFVFATRRVTNHRAELAIFFLIGLLGLAVNECVMKLSVDVIGVSYIVAKIPAIGLSFIFNFFIRRTLLFSGEKALLSQ